jgi:hypothetical protein
VLISMPTAISTMRGVFQVIAILPGVGRRMMSRIQRRGTHYALDGTPVAMHTPAIKGAIAAMKSVTDLFI